MQAMNAPAGSSAQLYRFHNCHCFCRLLEPSLAFCSAALDMLDACGSVEQPGASCFRLPPLLFPLASLASASLLPPLSPSLASPSILLYHTLRDESDGITQQLVAVSTGPRAAVSATVLQEVMQAEQVI